MPDTLTLKKGKGLGPNLNVRTNLAAWYRYRTAITNINGAASAWADQSGNTRPLLQATASARPSVRSDGALVFDGLAQNMQATFTLAQPLTIYLAFQQISWTSGDIIYDGVTGNVRLAQNTSSPGIAANAGSGLTVDNTAKVGSNAIACFVASGTSSVYQVAGGAATVSTTGDAGANSAGGITLGSSRTPANFGNIAVYEMIVYSVAHDATTRLSIMRYLGRIAAVGGIM